MKVSADAFPRFSFRIPTLTSLRRSSEAPSGFSGRFHQRRTSMCKTSERSMETSSARASVTGSGLQMYVAGYESPGTVTLFQYFYRDMEEILQALCRRIDRDFQGRRLPGHFPIRSPKGRIPSVRMISPESMKPVQTFCGWPRVARSRNGGLRRIAGNCAFPWSSGWVGSSAFLRAPWHVLRRGFVSVEPSGCGDWVRNRGSSGNAIGLMILDFWWRGSKVP